MTRLTIMTNEEIANANNKLAEMKAAYFNALDEFDYPLADKLYSEIVKLNNSIH